MSMSKMVPEGLKPQECERVKLCKPPPVPYVLEKDKVQDEVSKKRNMEIKTAIKKDTMMNFPVWQENGTREGFLMHMTAVLDAFKKRGHFEDYDKAAYAYEKARKANESARAGLALLSEGKELPKKLSKKKNPRKLRRKLLQRLLSPRTRQRLQKKARKTKLLLRRRTT
jgi:hypothetical protein